MKCKHCDYEFNRYMFAYKQIRKCPKCKQRYDMHFVPGVGFLPVFAALIICFIITFSMNLELMINLSIFVIVYYILDIAMKMFLIYSNKYTIVELDK